MDLQQLPFSMQAKHKMMIRGIPSREMLAFNVFNVPHDSSSFVRVKCQRCLSDNSPRSCNMKYRDNWRNIDRFGFQFVEKGYFIGAIKESDNRYHWLNGSALNNGYTNW